MLSGGFFPHHDDDELSSIHTIDFFVEDMNNPHTHNPHLQLQMQQQSQQHPQFAQDPSHHISRNSTDISQSYPNPSVQKTEMTSPTANDLIAPGSSDEKKPAVKPTKTLNRVPRTLFPLSLRSLSTLIFTLFFRCMCKHKILVVIPNLHLLSFEIQNACRKQKMRCEGAENPPCRRCRHAGLECLFEKPTREPTLTGEAGLE